MLDKLKQLGQLKSIQDEMKAQRFEAEREGIKVVINGSLMVEEVVLNNQVPTDQQNEAVKDCVNEAIKKAQQDMAQKLSGMNVGF